MKKYLLTFILIFFLSLFIFSQQINKNVVIVEIGTGTWCSFCPGAAMGADELVENFSNNVAIIENHGGDAYQISASSSRNSYNNAEYFPTATFNGQSEIVGGDHNNSLYPDYLPKYNSAISQMTSFNLTMDIMPVSDNTFNVTLTIDKIFDYTGTNLVVQLALTESHIEEFWQGQTELNFVNRGMFPSASGTTLDFSSETQQIVNYTVNIDSNWDTEKCELVAFVQDNTSKEVLQGAKASLNIPIGNNNVKIEEINYPNGDNNICETAISPVIKIKNRGNSTLTNFSIEYEINSEGIQTYNWNGSLEFSETTEVILDEITYNAIETNTLNIYLKTPNGELDDDDSNNSSSVSFNKSVESSSLTILEINPAGSFGLPWKIYNSEGTIIESGTASGDDIITEEFGFNIQECFEFEISSSFNNGIPGEGYFSLKDAANQVIYYGAGNSFTDKATIPFRVSYLVGIKDIKSSVNIFPNPANKYIEIESDNIQNIKVSDISGKIIFSKNYNNLSKTQINIEDFNSGIYFVTIYTNSKIITKKISVIK